MYIYNCVCVKETDSMASREEIADINNIKDAENGDANDNQFDKNKFQQGQCTLINMFKNVSTAAMSDARHKQQELN